MKRKFLSVRFWLTLGLFCSVLFAGWRIYHKVTDWGFNLSPNRNIPVWTIESHLTFKPIGKDIQIKLARPADANEYKVLDETIIANGYSVEKNKDSFILSREKTQKTQNIYYRIVVYDNKEGQIETKSLIKPKMNIVSEFDDVSLPIAREILETVKQKNGDFVQNLIQTLNNPESNEIVLSFMPDKKDAFELTEIIQNLLALEKIPSRLIRGVQLEEGRKTSIPDVMIEVYHAKENRWQIYHIHSGETGLPKDFVVLQRGGASLVDVTGGKDSRIKYSILKSLNSSFGMAKYRAKSENQEKLFSYSIYSLPINQQNMLKWLMIFPLAILIVVILRNIIGLKTMGTFTPMLISMALVETGFIPGLIAFALVVGVGLVIRMGLSKLNLLLVPRISAVVVFVILIIQISAIIGYQLDWVVASSVLFFPIIILAWVIERASIICEEEGLKNATKEVFCSVLVAVITYFVIVNNTIRHIMFAFNELNLVILFIVMLLGTYTGYRLTELKRFAPLVQYRDKK